MNRDTYQTSQLGEILGASRDALRYYEELGIVKPNQSETNNYRQFDNKDMYALMVADFYKKRNLSMREVRDLQEGRAIHELEHLLEIKADQLEKTIRNNQHMLQKIKETKAFCDEINKYLNNCSVRELPLYEVLGEFSDFYSFLEYPLILKSIDLKKDDILSKIMRTFTFNKDGFIDSKMYIVEKQKLNAREEHRSYLQHSRCIYTIVEDGRYENGDNDIKEKVFDSTLKWGNEHGLKPKGMAFVNTRLITYLDKKERAFLEIYIPVEEQ